MAIPDFQSLMLPTLRSFADGHVHATKDIAPLLAMEFKLSPAEMAETIPSGIQGRFQNRLTWAMSYLKQAGLVEREQWGQYRITSRGTELLANPPPKIDIRYLERYSEFAAFRARSNNKLSNDSGQSSNSENYRIETEKSTPEERLEAGYVELRSVLVQDLLQAIKKSSSEFFEQLVVDLLVRMGYGGTRNDAGQVIGKSGDGGIDGIIKEDRLGLDVIYLQAKRWESDVGRPEIQKFVGALAGNRAGKGVFLTTAAFTREAREYANTVPQKVVLIDGTKLAEYMIDFGLGVTTINIYEIKRVDTDYFSDN